MAALFFAARRSHIFYMLAPSPQKMPCPHGARDAQKPSATDLSKLLRTATAVWKYGARTLTELRDSGAIRNYLSGME